ncbi:tetrapyrrole methylase [Pyronema omphalodes]|nr:tetrapyrrole methylase [Pyronema omphalodes]
MPSLSLQPTAPGVPGVLPTLSGYAGLLTSRNSVGETHLLIGASPLAASRLQKSLDAGANVILISPPTELPYSIQTHINSGAVTWHQRSFTSTDINTLGRQEVDGIVDLVWVVSHPDAAEISRLCKKLRVPVNVVDKPGLCSFTLLASYTQGPLQIGVTTQGNGCKLASRIRREIVAGLPAGLGDACARIGNLRRRLIEEAGETPIDDADEATDQTATFNNFVTEGEEKTRRVRWLSQICEYWPLEKLVELDMEALEGFHAEDIQAPAIPIEGKKGSIALIGAGPGHPELLTTASLRAMETADLVLADKLVPAAVLELIPRRTPVFIAKKFPGNAEAAQEELLARGLAALKEGQTVVRLKQGDPYIYGRGGEEYLFFEKHGYVPKVLPGVTSALSAPMFAAIPATQRGVSDQVLICTGTGRKGEPPVPPEYVATRTTVFLMALHRIEKLVEELRTKGWPMDTPCAVVERASCADQRVVRTTLGVVGAAIEEVGSRPPGLLVVGHACGVLKGGWGEKGWVVEEGFDGF